MQDPFDEFQRALPKRYRLERKLKRGGMGYIYLARESHPDRQVAIKVLDPEVTVRLGRERFLREVSLLSNLTHPHIVPVFAAGDASDFLYYVMPFVEGETLGDRVARVGQLHVGVAMRIAYEVADALAYAHQRGIIHRDIKPANILMHDDHALVADFGIARAISVAESEPITEVGVALGTPSYMSPEQITGESTVDGRSDVYSLGCVLYEMLAGVAPFQGADTRTTMIKHVTDPPPPFPPRRTDLPVPVIDLVMRALEKEPAKRFSSAKEMSQALRDLGDPRTSWSGALATMPIARQGQTPGWVKPSLLVGAMVVVLILLWPRVVPRDSTLVAGAPRWLDSVAVFPLLNQTGDTTLDHVGRAIADLVNSSLTQIDSIKVSPPHSAEVLRDSAFTEQRLAAELGAGHLISGTLSPGPSGVAVRVQHFDATANALVWAPQAWFFDLSDVLREEERIAGEIIRYLSGGVLRNVTAASMVVPTLSPGHESYSLGAHFLARRTPDGINRAIQLFRDAIGEDSAYAQAYADLSVAHSLSLTYRYAIGLDGYSTAGRALAYADRAIQLDSSLAAGWAARGYIGALAGAPITDVAADFARARARNSAGASVASWSARVLARQGRFDEALEQASLAVQIDVASAGRRIAVALLELQRGSYPEAIAQAMMAQALEPNLVMPSAIAARAYLLADQPHRCAAMNLGPHRALQALCLAAMGGESDAAAIIDSVEAAAARGGSGETAFTAVVTAEDLASYYAWRGDATVSLGWVRNAFLLSPSGIDSQLRESAMFDNVRSDPVFADGLAEELAGRWPRVLSAAQTVDRSVLQ